MRGNAWIVALVCICAIWSLAGVAAAQRVVVVHPQSGDNVLLDVYYRLRAELRIHGFEALAVDWEGSPFGASDGAPALAQLADEHEAQAALLLSRRDAQATLTVWLLDQRRHSSLHRLRAEPSDDAASLLALRAVDLLRIALQPNAAEPDAEPETRPAPPEPARDEPSAQPDRQDAPAAEDEPEPVQPAPRPLWLSASALMLRAGDRLGLAFGPQLGVGWRTAPWLELSLQLAGPVVGVELATSLGRARTYEELAWLEARVFVLRPAGFELALLVGAGAYFMQATSSGLREPLARHDAQLWSAVFTGGAYVGYRLAARCVVGLALRAALFAPRVGVAVAEESALVDQPAFVASLGLGFGLL